MKIFTNAYPRSGTSTFTLSALLLAKRFMEDSDDQLYHNSGWVIKNHNPLLFLGDYPSDIVPCTIIRHPLDAISSNSFRWSKGYTGNMVHGLLVIDKFSVSNNITIDHAAAIAIDHQIDQYISYIHCLLKNPERVVMFTYDQVRDKTDWCVKSLMRFAGMDDSSIDIEIDYPKQGASSDEKTQMYFSIRDYIEASPKYQDALEYYNKAIELLEQKQDSYLPSK